MADEVSDLNYDFNYNLFLAKSMISNLSSLADRQKVLRWLRKLMSCNRSIDELKLRNDFLYYLVLQVQEGELKPPFSNQPPAGPHPNLSHLLPGSAQAEQAGAAASWVEKDQTQKSLLYSLSPDGGAFLAAQPIPKCGAFCYMAVVSKNPNKRQD